jgi:hypothetical protein
MKAHLLGIATLAAVLTAAVAGTAQADFFARQSIERLAPILVIQANEDNGPASGQWYLEHSRLMFSEKAPCREEVIHAPPWSDADIGGLGGLVPPEKRWSHRNKGGVLCRHNQQTYLATDHTRPFDSGRSGLEPQEGFFLDLNRSGGTTGGMPFAKNGGEHRFETQAPVYYDDGELFNADGSPQRPRRAFISYWFFYAFNDAPGVPLLFDHEGDWENVSLLLEQRPNEPNVWALKQVSYSAHGKPTPRDAGCAADVYAARPLSCPAPRALWAGNRHLVGFVADGSHATYATDVDQPVGVAIKGHGPIKDHTSSLGVGFSWPTWTGLRPLQAQGWAGFCGAWGEVAGKLPKVGYFGAGERTGPLGPGCMGDRGVPLKSGRPDGWGVSMHRGSFLTEPGDAVAIDPADLVGTGGGAPNTIITAGPPVSTTNDFGTVYFKSEPAGANFECLYDKGNWVPCANPKAYSQVALGEHTVLVRAVSAAGVDGTPAKWTWRRVAPDTFITAGPDGSIARHRVQIFFKADETTDVGFQCSLDEAAFSPCSNPQSYSGLALGPHSFRVRAAVLAALDETPAAAHWTVIRPETEITAGPPNSTKTTGTVYFRSPDDPDAGFQCSYDSEPWKDCSNPRDYSSIAKGPHTVQVRAVDLGAEDQTPAIWRWTRTG